MSSPAARSPRDLILILDFGGQYTQLIARRVREQKVYSEIHPFNLPVARIRELAPRACELVGSGAAARTLGLSVDKLRRAVQRGTVSLATITPGGHRRFATADLSWNGTVANGSVSPDDRFDGESSATA